MMSTIQSRQRVFVQHTSEEPRVCVAKIRCAEGSSKVGVCRLGPGVELPNDRRNPLC